MHVSPVIFGDLIEIAPKCFRVYDLADHESISYDCRSNNNMVQGRAVNYDARPKVASRLSDEVQTISKPDCAVGQVNRTQVHGACIPNVPLPQKAILGFAEDASSCVGLPGRTY